MVTQMKQEKGLKGDAIDFSEGVWITVQQIFNLFFIEAEYTFLTD